MRGTRSKYTMYCFLKISIYSFLTRAAKLMNINIPAIRTFTEKNFVRLNKEML